jgi:tetratricopeptide (TPR) repeat protein
MNKLKRMHRVSAPCMIALLLLLAISAAAQVPGWDPRWPPPAKVLAGCDPQLVREFRQQSAVLSKTPNDEETLVDRGVTAHRLTRTSRLGTFLDWLAAKDLERAIKLNPKDFAAWHNYGDLNYDSGDDWAHNSHANALRAVDAFNHAIALNPRSARSYLGRGWAYYQMNDQARANADFQKALQLDPSLRADMQKEIGNIQERHRQENNARGTVDRLASYFVEKSANTAEACSRYKCFWTNGECRCSTALNPGR